MYNSAIVLLKGLKTEFSKALSGIKESEIMSFTHKTKSMTDKETYNLFNVMGAIKELKDKLSFEDFKDFKYDIVNKHWERSTRVSKDTLDDSKGTVGNDLQMWINSLPDEFASLPDDLLNDLLVANTAAFDGTAFFATDRPLLKGTAAIKNLNTGTGITLAQLSADLKAARTSIKGFKNKNDKPFTNRFDLVVYCPVHLEADFLTLLNDQSVDLGSGPVSNIHKGSFTLVVNQYQPTTNNDWYFINKANPFKPFIYQDRMSPSFYSDKPETIKGLHIDFWVESRSNIGFGNPMACVKVNN